MKQNSDTEIEFRFEVAHCARAKSWQNALILTTVVSPPLSIKLLLIAPAPPAPPWFLINTRRTPDSSNSQTSPLSSICIPVSSRGGSVLEKGHEDLRDICRVILTDNK